MGQALAWTRSQTQNSFLEVIQTYLSSSTAVCKKPPKKQTIKTATPNSSCFSNARHGIYLIHTRTLQKSRRPGPPQSLQGFETGSVPDSALGWGTSCPAFCTHRHTAIICPEEICARAQGWDSGFFAPLNQLWSWFALAPWTRHVTQNLHIRAPT